VIDPFALTIVDARRLLRAREMTAAELVEAMLDRIEATEPFVHAYACVDSDGAMNAARRADGGPEEGPLHGIPFAVKDVLDTAGLRTEAGARLLAGRVPAADATAVGRLREAGAILLGKHVTHEFACGQDVPPTRNPWNLDHYPGGSSAGGGVSVAVGSSLAALGTDAGGSVRKPAAVTSTVGLKPTHGRVSGSGTVRAATAPSLDHVGTFTRTVEDAALLLQAIAGHDPADRRSLDVPVPDYETSLRTGVAGMRLGLDRGTFFGSALDPDVAALAEDAMAELERLGARLVPVELSSIDLALPAGFTILMAEVASVHRPWIEERPEQYVPDTRRMIELGLLLPAAHVEAAQRARALICAGVSRVFRESRLDALVTPTLPRTSMPLSSMVTSVDVPSLIPFTLPWNLTGQPALSVPCGFTPAGLPAGLQIVGRPFDEAAVLRIGHAYERATAWHQARPKLGATAAPRPVHDAGR
jgi:Asp-tRNA(Asn)/Glu-tRNA(Gln) amidotransferase A subunit family amidase